MRTYLITLAIDVDEGEKSPGRWDWGQVLDTPNAVSVVECTRLHDSPTPEDAALLRHWITTAHANVYSPVSP